jgi:cell division protein FtsN
MSDGYYPEYYLRKRKRDRVYALVTRLVVVAVLAGGLGSIGGFLTYQYVLKPKKQAAGVTEQMADQRQSLATAQKLSEAAKSATAIPVEGQTPIEFQPTQLSELRYADSMPLASVSLLGSTSAQIDRNTTQPATEPKDSSASASMSNGSDSVDASVSQTQESASSGVVSSSSAAVSQSPSTSQPADSAQTRAAQKATDGSTPKPTDKPKGSVQETQPAATDTPPQKPTSEQAYRVYAGITSSKEAADELRGKLTSVGLSGTVIKSGGDYLVLVATVPEFSQAEVLTSDLKGKGFSSFSTRVKGK